MLSFVNQMMRVCPLGSLALHNDVGHEPHDPGMDRKPRVVILGLLEDSLESFVENIVPDYNDFVARTSEAGSPNIDMNAPAKFRVRLLKRRLECDSTSSRPSQVLDDAHFAVAHPAPSPTLAQFPVKSGIYSDIDRQNVRRYSSVAISLGMEAP
jgi:hypothetical protein